MQAPGPSLPEVLSQLPLILGDRLEWMTGIHKKYGDIVRVPMGPRSIYAVFHPDYVRHVLVANQKNYWKGRTFEKTAAYMGKGLATTEGTEWQVQRRRMNPQFHRDALKGLTEIMVQNIEAMLARWDEAALRETTVDLAHEFQRLAMETVARCFFGMGVPETRILEIIEAFKIALKHTTRRTLNPFDIPETWPLPSNRKFQKAVAVIDEIVYAMIREERAKAQPSPTLLGLLVRAQDPETGEQMSEKQLRDEVLTMFIGGTDTSGNTLSWVFYNLDRLPEVQKRVRAELREAGRNFEKLDYTKRVVDETLRLFPQNWVGSRDAYGEDTIGGYTVPAGSTVFLGVYVVHRRPDFWENAETFDPDRFLPENLTGKHPLRYLPFGAGSRKCIGYNFAMMEICLTIAMALERFQFKVVKPETIKKYATWSLWPKPGVPVKLLRQG